METRALLLMLWTIVSLCETKKVDYGPECEYNGDMGLISVENCIAKIENDGNLERCHGVVYGPGKKIYRQRAETPFWIEIKPRDRTDYPDNLTYKILTMDEDYKLTQIRGCESMRLNHAGECVLPPLKEDEIHYIYLPLKDSEYSYCYYDIDEFEDGAIDFCDENETSCYKLMKNGRYIRIKPFNAVDSSLNYPIPTEFCFFPTPEIYIDKTRIPNDAFLQRNIKSEETGNNVSALLGGKKVGCKIVETRNSAEEPAAKFAPDYHDGISDYVCYFMRAVSQIKYWTPHAICLKVELEENATCCLEMDEEIDGNEENNSLGFILVVTILPVVAFAIIVAATCLFKTHLIRLTFKKNCQVLQRALAITPDNFQDCNDELRRPVQEKEIPCKITVKSEELEHPKEESLTRQSSFQANEEQIEKLRIVSETPSSRSEDASCKTTDFKNHTEEEFESDEEMQASKMIDNALFYDTSGECTQLDHSSQKLCDQVSENNQDDSIDKYTREDEIIVEKTEKDIGNSSKLPPYLKNSTNQFTVPAVMISVDYVRK